MATILLTGSGGFLGSELLKVLSEDHKVITIGRTRPACPSLSTHHTGCFWNSEFLQQLDCYNFDSLIHLAAVTGGCSEQEGFEVNAEGTRRLLKYISQRGCNKAILASSIAVVGIQSTEFRPLQVPIPDEHPCLDRDGYGFSKYLMEQIAHYMYRQNPALDIINLRLAALYDENAEPPLIEPCVIFPWALGAITRMSRSDAVAAFKLAAEAAYCPGVRTLNAVSKKAWVKKSTAAVLQNWWGDEVDLSFFHTAENRKASVFDHTNIKKALGFEA